MAASNSQARAPDVEARLAPADLRSRLDELTSEGAWLEHELRQLISACLLRTALDSPARAAAIALQDPRCHAAKALATRWRIACWRLSALVESNKLSGETRKVLGATEARVLALCEQLGSLIGPSVGERQS